MKTRVVITGLGALSPLGHTAEETWKAAIAGTSGAGPITRFDASNFKTKFACEISNFDVNKVLDRKQARRLDPFVQYALVASDEAIKDAGLDQFTEEQKEDIAVLWASGIGGLSSLEDEITKYATGSGTPRHSPLLIPKMITDAAAGNISIRNGFKGMTAAVITACASSTHSIGLALDLIRAGRTKVVLAGGSEASITATGIGAFNSLKALSTRNDDPKRGSCPYSKDRDGFVMGEGGAALVIEEYEHAVARGAHIYAELIGSAATADAYHITAPDPTGDGAAKVMQKALKDAGIKKEAVDYINTHGTSTLLGDVMELRAIEQVFEEHAPKLNISATKSMTGHLLGATGALEALLCIKALEEGIVPPTMNVEEVDPEISADLNLTLNKAETRDIAIALSNSFGFGGHNSTIVFKKFEK